MIETHTPSEPLLRNPVVELRHYLQILLANWWIPAIAILAFGLVAMVTSIFITPTYETNTTLLIDEAPNTGSSDYNSLLASERLARTYAQLLTDEPVLQETITRLGLSLTVTELREQVSAQRIPETQLIEIAVRDVSPERATLIANTVVAVFIEQTEAIQSSRYAESEAALQAQLSEQNRQIEQTNAAIDQLGSSESDRSERERLEALLATYQQTYANLLQSYEEIRIAQAQSSSNVIQVKAASVPDTPVSPNLLVNTLLGLALGAIFGTGIIVIREMADDTIRSSDQVGSLLGLPTLGVISVFDVKRSGTALVTASQSRTSVVQAFRSLRTNIQYASVDKEIHSILVTSPSPHDGKSTIAANLGIIMAQNRRRVILVEGDLHHPSLSRFFSRSNHQGLSDLFLKPLDYLERYLLETSIPNLMLLPAGPLPPNPTELLDSNRSIRLLEKLEQLSDVVVVDSPPVLALADAAILAARVDAVLLVLWAGRTKVRAAREALSQLEHAGANLIGVVVNGVNPRSESYGYYYYQYGGYGERESSERNGNGENGHAGSAQAEAVLKQRVLALQQELAGAESSMPAPAPGSHEEPTQQSPVLELTELAASRVEEPIAAPVLPRQAGRRRPRRRPSPSERANTLFGYASALMAAGISLLAALGLFLLGGSWMLAAAAGLLLVVPLGLVLLGTGWWFKPEVAPYGLALIGIGAVASAVMLTLENLLPISGLLGRDGDFLRVMASLLLLGVGMLFLMAARIRSVEDRG